MKKILPALVLLSVSAVLAVPLVVSAQAPPTSCAITKSIVIGGFTCPNPSSVETQGICCVLQTIYNITDWIFIFLVALAGVLVIIGAYNLLTAGGNPAKVDTGRNYIMYAAVGLLVAFLAKALPGIIKMLGGLS